jgi:hypothetical protein
MHEFDSAIRGYREAARGTARLVDAIDGSLDPAKTNKCADNLRAHYMTLRKTRAGRDAITSLMNPESVNVS